MLCVPIFIVAKPEVVLNRTKVDIFGGEDIRIGCNGFGLPEPSLSWKHGSHTFQEVPRNILHIDNAAQNQSGLYTCVAENKYGSSSKTVKVTVNSEYPSTPFLQLINRSETSLQLSGGVPEYIGRGYIIKHYILRSEEIPLQVMVNESSSFTRKICKLMPATEYRFTLTACNPFVCSDPFTASFATAEQGRFHCSLLMCKCVPIYIYCIKIAIIKSCLIL